MIGAATSGGCGKFPGASQMFAACTGDRAGVIRESPVTRSDGAVRVLLQAVHDRNLPEESMANPTDESRCADACRHRIEDDGVVHARIRSEYRQMPGLRLTLPQAARLFGLEPASCERMLNALVVDGELWKNGHEFVRPRRF